MIRPPLATSLVAFTLVAGILGCSSTQDAPQLPASGGMQGAPPPANPNPANAAGPQNQGNNPQNQPTNNPPQNQPHGHGPQGGPQPLVLTGNAATRAQLVQGVTVDPNAGISLAAYLARTNCSQAVVGMMVFRNRGLPIQTNSGLVSRANFTFQDDSGNALPANQQDRIMCAVAFLNGPEQRRFQQLITQSNSLGAHRWWYNRHADAGVYPVRGTLPDRMLVGGQLQDVTWYITDFTKADENLARGGGQLPNTADGFPMFNYTTNSSDNTAWFMSITAGLMAPKRDMGNNEYFTGFCLSAADTGVDRDGDGNIDPNTQLIVIPWQSSTDNSHAFLLVERRVVMHWASLMERAQQQRQGNKSASNPNKGGSAGGMQRPKAKPQPKGKKKSGAPNNGPAKKKKGSQ